MDFQGGLRLGLGLRIVFTFYALSAQSPNDQRVLWTFTHPFSPFLSPRHDARVQKYGEQARRFESVDFLDASELRDFVSDVIICFSVLHKRSARNTNFKGMI